MPIHVLSLALPVFQVVYLRWDKSFSPFKQDNQWQTHNKKWVGGKNPT